MAYTIYKNVKVVKIKQEEVTPTNRPKDISGDNFGRDNFTINVAELSNVTGTVSFSDFKNIVIAGHTVSLAVNDNYQVISVINHTNGKQGYLQKKNIFKDILEGIIIFLIIIGVCGGVAFNALRKNNLEIGYGAIAVGVLVIGFIINGINKQYRESLRSFNKLK